MKPIFLTMILLALTVPAYADWPGAGMHPAIAPNLIPRPVQHESAPRIRVEPQQRFQQAQPAVHYAPPAANHTQPVRHDDRRLPVTPAYFRHDIQYYGHSRVIFPYADVDSIFVVPDGFEAVVVDGQTYYYNEGVFYQQIGNQLTAIPPVLGAVVDSIPEDYQIVFADGVHYLFTGGTFYQRVDQGFEVVQPPVSDQE